MTARLEHEAADVARRGLATTAEFLALTTAFRAAALDVVPLKGPSLAAALYGSPVLRHYRDLDFLVDRGEVEAAVAVLRDHGYRPAPPLPPAAERALLPTQAARTFVRQEAVVDLHWALTPRVFGVDLAPAALRRGLREIDLGGVRVRVPGADDLLVLLTIHGGKHLWERLGWLADVAELLRAPGLDHAGVAAEAQRRGVQRLVHLGLGLAHRLLDAPLPAAVGEAIARDRALAGLAAQVCRRRLALAAAPAGIVETAIFHVRSRERGRDRLRYALRWALTPTSPDRQLVALPPRLDGLYALLRPFRLAAKYGRRTLARADRRQPS